MSCAGGRAMLQPERMALLFIDTIQIYRAQAKFLLHEFVIMPNHAHLIISPSRGITLEKAVQFVKGGFSYRVGKEFGEKGEIWQRGYVDHRIRDARDFAYHRTYIHINPMRARLCYAPEEFAYSSANPTYSLDSVPQGLKPLAAESLRHD
jgi:putative transposase